MIDRAIFLQSVPADVRENLAFARWQESMHLGTHAEGCHTWGRTHYECAKRHIAKLEAALTQPVQPADHFRSAAKMMKPVQPAAHNAVLKPRGDTT